MAMTYAVVGGRVTQPGTDVGIRARVTLTPNTEGGFLKFPTEDQMTWGPQTAESDTAGSLGTLKVPTNVPAGTTWRIDVEALDRLPGVPKSWTLGNYEITADTRLEDLVPVELLAVTPTTLDTVAQYAADAQAAAASVQREQPSGVAGLDTNGKLYDARIPDWLKAFVTPEQFGAVGDGVANDLTAVQSALNAGKAVALTKTYNLNGGDLTFNTTDGVLFGGGTLKDGSLTLGLATGARVDRNIQVVGLKFLRTSVTAGNHGLRLRRIGRCKIRDCYFENQDYAVYVMPVDEAQHVRRTIIDGCTSTAANTFIYFDKPVGATSTFPTGDVTVSDCQTWGTGVYGIYGEGVDGLVVSGCVFFFPGWTSQNTAKKNNIYLYQCNWVRIIANNLFEAGTDAIKIGRFQNLSIVGNGIAWPGQASPGNGISLWAGDTSGDIYCISSITGNTIMFPTRNGIEIADNCGDITVSGNVIRAAGYPNYYYGTTSLDSMSHYGISTQTTGYVTVVGNSSPADIYNFGATTMQSKNTTSSKRFAVETVPTLTVSTAVTSIDVTGYPRVNLNTPTTSISSFTGGDGGQRLTMIAFTGNTTLVNSSSLRLKGAVNVTVPNGGVIEFVQTAGNWYEVSRSW